MVAFALKGRDTTDEIVSASRDINSGPEQSISGSHFSNMALKYVNHAMEELEDEPLSLRLLQALILITHWLLIRNVRGRALRYLGLCVSSAYELNFHLIDFGQDDQSPHTSNPTQWSEDEEKRRAWWSIWEMDVFASVMRRCPTTIDWCQNETFLPAEDVRWFSDEPQQSCRLETDVVQRWKVLSATGNRSPKAWFIVINSLMKEAQKITSPKALERDSNVRSGILPERTKGRHEPNERSDAEEAVKPLWMVQNSLRCSIMALPDILRYEHQLLDFGVKETESREMTYRRRLHSSIYSIHMMSQLARLMIYKYYIFRTGLRWPNLLARSQNFRRQSRVVPLFDKDPHHGISSTAEINAFEQYFETADDIMVIIRRSSVDHFKFVNPFLANITWLAGAVQLLHRELVPKSSSDRNVIQSNLELLTLTYNQFASFWNMSTTMQKNLEAIENELGKLHTQRRGGSRGHNDLPVTSLSSTEQDCVKSHKNKFEPGDSQQTTISSAEQRPASKGASVALLGLNVLDTDPAVVSPNTANARPVNLGELESNILKPPIEQFPSLNDRQMSDLSATVTDANQHDIKITSQIMQSQYNAFQDVADSVQFGPNEVPTAYTSSAASLALPPTDFMSYSSVDAELFATRPDFLDMFFSPDDLIMGGMIEFPD